MKINKLLLRHKPFVSVIRKDVVAIECRSDSSGHSLDWRAGVIRLHKLNLISLEHGRLRSDLTGVYKIMRAIDRIDSQNSSLRTGLR